MKLWNPIIFFKRNAAIFFPNQVRFFLGRASYSEDESEDEDDEDDELDEELDELETYYYLGTIDYGGTIFFSFFYSLFWTGYFYNLTWFWAGLICSWGSSESLLGPSLRIRRL